MLSGAVLAFSQSPFLIFVSRTLYLSLNVCFLSLLRPASFHSSFILLLSSLSYLFHVFVSLVSVCTGSAAKARGENNAIILLYTGS